MEKIFQDKVALVTGGSFGIGRAAAISFANRGAKVVIADWVEDNETLNAVKSTGGEAIFLRCDVSKDAEVKNLIVKTVATFGQLDYAFNNAGVEGASAPTQDCTEENWERVVGVNLKGIWLCMKYEIPQMLR
ncbi:MAG TPA: SDR family NAD(P)-dependent oxidoreductase, partial [Bacteroidia bacterium]|nr:SDR family NAD(P)-dependent oxidoreductase [Bacteroidia bacterium]